MTTATQPQRGGRRPGESGTRETILAAARGAFAELGYDRTTIPGIAADAVVDPALVIHFFGSKDELFGAALEIPVEPGVVLERAAAADPYQVGATIARAFLEAWEPPDNRQRLVAMVRSAMTNEVALRMVREYLGRRVFGLITQALGVPNAQLRANFVGSQFIGLAMMRYITSIKPIASPPVGQLVAAIGPTVQRYLTGDIDESGATAGGAIVTLPDAAI